MTLVTDKHFTLEVNSTQVVEKVVLNLQLFSELPSLRQSHLTYSTAESLSQGKYLSETKEEQQT